MDKQANEITGSEPIVVARRNLLNKTDGGNS